MSSDPASAASSASSAALPQPLPLFPLPAVLFPGGLLGLKVFEARYLDMVASCLRERQPFGVICLREGAEVGRSKQPTRLEPVGVLAHILDVDSEQTGILQLRCVGGRRFRLRGAPEQRTNGLWVADVETIADDEATQPLPELIPTVQALAEAAAKLKEKDMLPFTEPLQFDDAGWVANRWCELLPVSLAAKQKLMELDDPVIRLSLVDGFLRDKKVVVG
jgi:Lon protease-like protein